MPTTSSSGAATGPPSVPSIPARACGVNATGLTPRCASIGVDETPCRRGGKRARRRWRRSLRRAPPMPRTTRPGLARGRRRTRTGRPRAPPRPHSWHRPPIVQLRPRRRPRAPRPTRAGRRRRKRCSAPTPHRCRLRRCCASLMATRCTSRSTDAMRRCGCMASTHARSASPARTRRRRVCGNWPARRCGYGRMQETETATAGCCVMSIPPHGLSVDAEVTAEGLAYAWRADGVLRRPIIELEQRARSRPVAGACGSDMR